MRKLVISSFIFFIAFNISGQPASSLAFTDISYVPANIAINGQFKTTPLKIANHTYFGLAASSKQSQLIEQLQLRAASYTIKSAAIFDDTEKATYLIVFKNKGNKLIARYSNQGEILSTVERYKNIALPIQLKVNIAKAYPGWVFVQNKCIITYGMQKGIQRTYKVKLKRGNLTKTLKIES